MSQGVAAAYLDKLHGRFIGAATKRVQCPRCRVPLQAYRDHALPAKEVEGYWRCRECRCVYGPPKPAESPRTLDALGLLIAGKGEQTAEAFPFPYAIVVGEDAAVRLILNGKEHTLSIAQVCKFSQDVADIARAAKDLHKVLRGDDRWRVRPHPTRQDVFVVRGHAWGDGYEEADFVQTTIRKARRCDACRSPIEAGSICWKQEKPESYPSPSWREVRLCGSCVRG